MPSDSSYGLVLFIGSVATWGWLRARKFERSYWAERRGRTRVEQEMRRITKHQLKTDVGFFVQPIGTLRSCYRHCIGTPRQGLLVPSSRATIVLSSNMSPESMDGLSEFSHVWLSFQFHLNTNTLKEAKAFKGVVEDSSLDVRGRRAYTFSAKITPPMLKEKKGVLATRSPHRPNPVGLTLARIDRVDMTMRSIHLTACDLVDGTPILDIKPYVPAYDNIPQGDWRIPEWIRDSVGTRNHVSINPEAAAFAHSNMRYLREYRDDADAYLMGLRETLEAEVRSKFQTKKRVSDADRGVSCEVLFDETLVEYLWVSERAMEVQQISLTTSPEQVAVRRKIDKKLRKKAQKTEE